MLNQTTPGRPRWLPALLISVILVWFGTNAHSLSAERPPRLAAEWEPALGALIVWPPIVPDS